jgi:hypothetical protein
MPEYSDREQCSYFEHLAVLNLDERNDLDEYLNGLPEFKEWYEVGFLLELERELLKASAKVAGSSECRHELCKSLLPLFRQHKELGLILRKKVRNWCKAMVNEAA